MAYIPISQLNELTNSITFGDFFPLVTSSSLTTYKVTLKTLNDFLDLPQISCSWTSQSVSSSYALSASYPPYPQYSMSWSDIGVSSSYSISASWAPSTPQKPQYSCSYATSESFSASYALSASYSPQSQQQFPISMSWASSSFSSSYTTSASWAPGVSTIYQPIVYLTSPVIAVPKTKTPGTSTVLGTTLINYTIPNTIPYRSGIILQTITSGSAGASGNVYASSSIISYIIYIGGLSHSMDVSIFYANVGIDRNLFIGITSYYVGSVWQVNIIGYY